MNNKYAKYANAIMFLGALLMAWVFSHYLAIIVGYYQLGRTFGANVDVYETFLAVAVGALTFFLLKRNAKAAEFISDAVHELLNVSWPNEKEVKLGTIVVIITVILSGIALGTLDIGLLWFVRQAIGA
jgi:preprotein translocase SecE subunit